jgi:hypothetical protein
MELVFVIAGIVLVWKFSSTMNVFAIIAKSKSEIVAEKVIADCVEERTDNFDDFQKRMEGKQVYTHDEIMQSFRAE